MRWHVTCLVYFVLLRGETEEDEIPSEPLPEPSDLITDEDVFPEDRIEVGEDDAGDEDAGLFPGLPGPVIAAATFVPTFLAVFFGLSYLLGPQTGPMASAPVPSAARAMSDMGTPGTPPLSEAVRDPFVAPRAPDSPSTRPSDPREATRPSEPPESTTRAERRRDTHAARRADPAGTTAGAAASPAAGEPPRRTTATAPASRAEHYA